VAKRCYSAERSGGVRTANLKFPSAGRCHRRLEYDTLFSGGKGRNRVRVAHWRFQKKAGVHRKQLSSPKTKVSSSLFSQKENAIPERNCEKGTRIGGSRRLEEISVNHGKHDTETGEAISLTSSLCDVMWFWGILGKGDQRGVAG